MNDKENTIPQDNEMSSSIESYEDLRMGIVGKEPEPTSLFDFLVPKTGEKPGDPKMMAERLSRMMESYDFTDELEQMTLLLDILDEQPEVGREFSGFMARIEENQEYLKEVISEFKGEGKDREAFGDVFKQINDSLIINNEKNTKAQPKQPKMEQKDVR